MAYGLFKVNKDLTVLLNPEAVKLCPDLAFLTDDQIKYIICVYDYIDSPYRKKPLEERKSIVFGKIFKQNDPIPEELEGVKKGIDAYLSLIYDDRRIQIEIYQNKIHRLQKKLDEEESTSEITKISEAISKMRKEKELIDKSMEIEEELIELKGGGQLSFIEIWKRNRAQALAQR